MDIKIFCNDCKTELFIKNMSISMDGDLYIDIERCQCKDETVYETAYNTAIADLGANQ